MEFSELIQKRQSDRKYKDEPVRREDIVKCLEAARLAPSACNSQPWRFVVVEDKAALKEMSEAAIGLGMNKFTAGVPVMVAVFSDSSFVDWFMQLPERMSWETMANWLFGLALGFDVLLTALFGWLSWRRLNRMAY